MSKTKKHRNCHKIQQATSQKEKKIGHKKLNKYLPSIKKLIHKTLWWIWSILKLNTIGIIQDCRIINIGVYFFNASRLWLVHHHVSQSSCKIIDEKWLVQDKLQCKQSTQLIAQFYKGRHKDFNQHSDIESALLIKQIVTFDRSFLAIRYEVKKSMGQENDASWEKRIVWIVLVEMNDYG